MTMIAIDKRTLENIALQLEARCDPVFMGQELRAIVAAAKPVITDPDLLADLSLEVTSYGQCRGTLHGDPKKACECRHCRVIRRITP